MSFAISTFFLPLEWILLHSSASVSIELSSRTVARKVFSPLQSLTSVFGMGTGGPSAFVTPTIFSNSSSLNIEQHYSTKNVLRLTLNRLNLQDNVSRLILRSP